MLQGLLSNEGRDLKTAIISSTNWVHWINFLVSIDYSVKVEKISDALLFLHSNQINLKFTILQGTKPKFILNCTDPETAKAVADFIGK